MSYEQYWEGDPWMVRAYREAHLLKRKERNEEMWIMGAYIADSFGITLSNAFSKGKKLNYMEKPLDIFPKTEAEKEAEVREKRRKFAEYLNGLKREFDNSRKSE